jgi:hypothetical protein
MYTTLKRQIFPEEKNLEYSMAEWLWLRFYEA